MTALKCVIDSTVVEAVKKAIGSNKPDVREVYADIAAAKKAFESATKAAGEGFPAYAAPDSAFFLPKLDKAGNPAKDKDGNVQLSDERIEGINAAVAVVGCRDEAAKKNGIKAIVMFPIPTVEAFRESEKGTDWVAKIIEKEASHVAFRQLRNAESVEEFGAAFAAMPQNVEDFVTQHTRGEGLDTETFDIVWPALRQHIKSNMPDVYEFIPAKAEALKAIRSSAYAKSEFPNEEKNGIFLWLAKGLIAGAAAWKDDKGEPNPLDASTIEQWVAERDSIPYTKQVVEKDYSKLESLDLGF